MSTFKKSLFLSFSQKYVELGIKFISILVLARLLTPEEVGLYSIIAALTLLAHMFRDFGLSTYIVQEKELTTARLRAAQTVAFGTSFGMGLMFLVLHKNIAAFYERQEVETVAIFAAINFFLIPFGTISLSLLRKELRFDRLFHINIASSFIHATSAILLAYSGYSYLSLAWASILGTLTTVIISMIFSPHAFFILPGIRDLRRVINFGGKASYVAFLQALGSAMPELIIGKFYGAHFVGLYSRAQGIIRLFHVSITQGILPVILPHYVKKVQKGKDIKPEFLRISIAIACISWPFFLYVLHQAEPIILFLFGENWQEAAWFLKYLAIVGILGNTYSMAGNVFVAMDRINLQVRVHSVSHILGLIMIAITAFHSLESMLLAIVLFRLLHLALSLHHLRQVISIESKEMLHTFLLPAMVTAITIVPVIIADAALTSYVDSWLWRFLPTIPLVTLSWISANWLLKTPIAVEGRGLLQSAYQRIRKDNGTR